MAQKRVVKKKVRKKKVAKTGAPPSKAAAPAAKVARRSGHKPYKPKPSLPGEGMGFGGIIMLLVGLGLLGFIVFIFLPKDISHIKGYPYDPSVSPEQPRNVLREVHDVLVQKGTAENPNSVTGSLIYTEEELNQYLQKRIKYSQGGLFSSFIEMQGVYVDLEKDEVTAYIVREMFGMPLTIDVTFEVFESDGKLIRRSTGSSIGRLHFNSIFGAIEPPFKRLAQVLNADDGELRMSGDPDIKRIRIETDQLTLEY